ncbi:hypothetical protein GCM10009576_096710 [Streptomyces rhizosphaericus]|uniref:Uncharacterized protein n=1 Tax=Streptomyces rhizosphaericus TaxID=114699 RepID=A0ABN1SSC9_9ACTN
MSARRQCPWPGQATAGGPLWRVKIERCVRFMIAQLPEDDVAPHLWTTLAGRPRMHREDPRGATH